VPERPGCATTGLSTFEPAHYNLPVDRRALNRATLARQLLLRRQRLAIPAAVERLLALQAQLPRPAVVGLWTRVEALDRQSVARLFDSRTLVRATTMRGTLHVMTAGDYLAFRHCLQPGLDAGMRAILRDRAAALDVAALGRAAEAYLGEPHDFEDIRAHLLTAFPGGDERAMGYAVRMGLPLVQVPGAGPWGFPAHAGFVSAKAWLGKAPAPCTTPDALVLRYLAALGPATIKDAESWLGLGGLAPAFARLQSRLAVVGGTARAPLYDLPDAPRPDGDTPAPIRFLPEWDSVVVTRADERVVAKADRPRVFLPGLRVAALVLVDGFAAASWGVSRTRKAATLKIEPFAALSKRIVDELRPEAESLVRFMEPDAATHEIEVKRA
jgi:hypothetical protein